MVHAFTFLTAGHARDGPDGHGPLFLSHAHRINKAEQGAVCITPYHTFSAEVDRYRTHHWRCSSCSMLIKRAINRPPAPRDNFWPAHHARCPGAFEKIAEPPPKVKPPKFRALPLGLAPGMEGVMRTQRIDHMLAPRAKPLQNIVTCPVCTIQVKELHLNEHLDACLADAVFTHRVEESCSKSPLLEPRACQSPHNSPSTPQYSPIALKQHLLQIPHAPPDSPPRAISESHVKSPAPTVISNILDSRTLMNLAINPTAVTKDNIRQTFAPLPSTPSPTNSRSDDLIPILKPLLMPESPFDTEQLAKAHIRPLIVQHPSGQDFSFFQSAARLGMPQESLFQLLKDKSRKARDGTLSLSEDAINLISSSSNTPSSGRHSPVSPVKPKLKLKTKPKPTKSTGDEDRMASKKVWGRNEKNKDSVWKRLPVAKPSSVIEKNQKKRPSNPMGNCPLCDQSVEKSQLQQHVQLCLADSDIAPFIFSDEEAAEKKPDVQPKKVEQPSGPPPKQSEVAESSRCPICDVRIARKDLEAHVATCMMSTGLADAF